MGNKLVEVIDIDRIEIGSRMRPTDSDKSKALADDIAEIGQLQPIGVRVDGDGYSLVFGAHRLAACAELGKPTIEAKILHVTLCRPELSKLQKILCGRTLDRSSLPMH